MKKSTFIIRNANPEEYEEVGKLLVKVYSKLEGFPKESEQPEYYKMLANVGKLTTKPGVQLLIVLNPENQITGAVVYFNDMQYYGSGGTATQEKNAAGFRLLAVDPLYRGAGIGKELTLECIKRAKEGGLKQVVIHTTNAMQTAWKMYEKLGFKRSNDLDFMQDQLQVFGFRLVN